MADTIYTCNGGIPAHPTDSGCCSQMSSRLVHYRIAPTSGSLKMIPVTTIPVHCISYIAYYYMYLLIFRQVVNRNKNAEEIKRQQSTLPIDVFFKEEVY